MPSARRASVVTRCLGAGLIAANGIAPATFAAEGGADSTPASPLTGFVTDVGGNQVRLSLTERDGIRAGDLLSVIEYGEEIARVRVRSFDKTGALADVIAIKPNGLLRRLDAVVPATSMPHPATDLVAPPEAPAVSLAPKERPSRARRRRRDDGAIVSRADWTYPALSTLADDRLLGNLPAREFHGDQQLTRREIRDLLSAAMNRASATAESGKVVPRDQRLLFDLAREYDVASDLPAPKPGLAVSTVHRYRAASGDEATLSASGVYQGLAHLGRDRLAVVSIGRGRREWYGDRKYPWIDEAFGQARWLGVNWQIGRKALRWGPGYTGSLVLGDVEPTLPMMRGQTGWSLGRLGFWNLEQFASTFKESDGRKYFLGRRLTHPFSSKLSMGLSETMKSASGPNATALVLPFLVYQRLYYHNAGTNVENVQEDLDLQYRTGRHEAYGELFIDDITAPKGLSSQGHVPRKIGYLIGWRHDHLFGLDGTDLRVEYAMTDRNTTLHRNPSVSLYDRGFPLGHPMGPNARSVLIRADRQVTPRLAMTGAVQFLGHNQPGAPDAASGTAFTLAAAYDFRQDRSLTLKVSPGRRVDRYDLHATGSVELIADWRL